MTCSAKSIICTLVCVKLLPERDLITRRNMRPQRLTVERLGSDCIDVRVLNRARLFAGEAQRVRFGLRWSHLLGMIAYRYRLELRFGRETFPQNVRVHGPNATSAANVLGFIALDVADALQSFIGVANGSTIGADNVSATFSTPAKPKVPQGGDCMRLGNCGCGLARTRSMRVLTHLFGTYGVKRLISARTDVRFTPKSGHWNSVVECPLLCQKRTSGTM
jgi:hypothetical protein